MPPNLNATYQPSTLGQALAFGFLVAKPGRTTAQQVSERMIPGSNDVIIDVIGKAVTKIQGQARIDSFQGLKTFEGAVGTSGTLTYSEELSGVSVLFVSITRDAVTPHDIHICSVEFWVLT